MINEPKSPIKQPDLGEVIDQGIEDYRLENLGFDLSDIDPEIASKTFRELLNVPAEEMYPEKTVTWQGIRNIINSLTNQLYLARKDNAKLDLELAYISHESIGGRYYEAVGVSYEHEAWRGFSEDDIAHFDFASGSSGSRLIGYKIANGKWTIKYIPPDYKVPEVDNYGRRIDKFYQGAYYGLYVMGDRVQNVNENYVNNYQ